MPDATIQVTGPTIQENKSNKFTDFILAVGIFLFCMSVVFGSLTGAVALNRIANVLEQRHDILFEKVTALHKNTIDITSEGMIVLCDDSLYTEWRKAKP